MSRYNEDAEDIRQYLDSDKHWHSLENCQPSLDTNLCDYINYDLNLCFSFGECWNDGIVYTYVDTPTFVKKMEFNIYESADIVKFLKNEQKLIEERDLRWLNYAY